MTTGVLERASARTQAPPPTTHRGADEPDSHLRLATRGLILLLAGAPLFSLVFALLAFEALLCLPTLVRLVRAVALLP
jgi:hypothetical protein